MFRKREQGKLEKLDSHDYLNASENKILKFPRSGAEWPRSGLVSMLVLQSFISKLEHISIFNILINLEI